MGSGYAALCLTLLLVMSPARQELGAYEVSRAARLDAAISAFVSTVTLEGLASSDPSALCGSAQRATNATIAIDVVIDGVRCMDVPPGTLGMDDLPVPLPGREVIIEAWLARP